MNASKRKKDQSDKNAVLLEGKVMSITNDLNQCVVEKQELVNDLNEMKCCLLTSITGRVKYNLLSDEYSLLHHQVNDLPTVDTEMSIGKQEHEDFANRIREERMRQVRTRLIAET